MANPYSKMVEIMRSQGAVSNPPSIQIGIVMEPPPNLVIKVNDLQIDKDNLLISDYLLTEHKRRVIISGGRIQFEQYDPPTYIGSTTEEYDGGRDALPHDHKIKELKIDTAESPEPKVWIEAQREDMDYIKTVDTLVKGDLLAVMPVADRQLYIILSRLREVS